MPLNITKKLTRALTSTYALFDRTGLTKFQWFQKLFVRTYYCYKKYLEDPFYNLTKNYPELFENGNIIDVGANIGYTTIVFSNAIDKLFKVYAFEPHPVIFDNMDFMVSKYSNSANIIRVNSAIGDNEGEIQLIHNTNHHGDHQIITNVLKENIKVTKVYNVPITSIDSFVEKNSIDQVCFIKIDVQGYEHKVISGMSKTLEDNPNISIALEYDPIRMSNLGFDPDELLFWVGSSRFKLYLIESNGELRKEKIDSLIKEIKKNNTYVNLLLSKQIFN
jgi:FkbM family methyltransferase